MSDILAQAINGDMSAFSTMYADTYKNMYYVAYYSLVNGNEATKAVKAAADQAYAEIGRCKKEKDFEYFFLKKLCEQIISCYREYRKNTPEIETNPPYIKSVMLRLTDAERLSVCVWAVFGLSPKEISELTGLAGDVVKKKLESGQNKIASKL